MTTDEANDDEQVGHTMTSPPGRRCWTTSLAAAAADDDDAMCSSCVTHAHTHTHTHSHTIKCSSTCSAIRFFFFSFLFFWGVASVSLAASDVIGPFFFFPSADSGLICICEAIHASFAYTCSSSLQSGPSSFSSWPSSAHPNQKGVGNAVARRFRLRDAHLHMQSHRKRLPVGLVFLGQNGGLGPLICIAIPLVITGAMPSDLLDYSNASRARDVTRTAASNRIDGFTGFLVRGTRKQNPVKLGKTKLNPANPWKTRQNPRKLGKTQ